MFGWTNYIFSRSQDQSYEKTSNNLLIGQYALLGIALYEFYVGNNFKAAFLTSLAVYLEQAASQFYEKVAKDTHKAKYISDHYSKLTKLGNLFQPAVSTIASTIQEDCQRISKNFRK